MTEPHGDSVVGTRIKLWWGGDRRYYKGVVTKYVAGLVKPYEILYDDGETKYHNLDHSGEVHRRLGEGPPLRPHGQSCWPLADVGTAQDSEGQAASSCSDHAASQAREEEGGAFEDDDVAHQPSLYEEPKIKRAETI